MPRQRKPSEIQERTGAFRHNPDRRRVDIPGGDALVQSEPPVGLGFDEFEAQAWRDLVTWTPAEIGKTSDASTYELGARILGKIRRTKEVTAADASQLRQILNSLGQSPAGRASLAVPVGKKKESSPEDKFRVVPAVEQRGKDANAN